MASRRLNPLDNLLVGIPLGELGYQCFWQELLALPDFGYLISARRVITISGGYIHGQHNQLALEALNGQVPRYKRLLLLEHDHSFPADVFRRHSQYTEPVVCGTYVLRDVNEPLPVAYNWDEPRQNALHPKPAEMKAMLDNPGLHRVDVVPMGCTSIRRDVLEKWPEDQPMFNSFTNSRGSTMSDDVWFCRIAQDAGWDIYLDTSLQVKHLVLTPIDVPYFVNWWNRVGSHRTTT